MSGRTVLVIGAGGQMTGRAARTLVAERPEGVAWLLADVSRDALDRVTRGLPRDGVETLELDLYDDEALRRAVRRADFVIHGAGPYHRTAQRVRPLCIEHGADYIDIDDDVESGLEAIALDAAAREAGVALYVGCGASPGLTNVLARDLIDRVDEALDVEVAWCTGNEEAMQVGRAVAEHTLHIAAGDCVTWRDGKQVVHRSFEDSVVFPMGPLLGDYRLYECAHPETVMIPHSFPGLRNVTCWGGIHPLPTVGLLKGVAGAERDGSIGRDEACGFLQDLLGGRRGSLAVWRHALAGALAQIRRGEVGFREALGFAWGELRGGEKQVKMGVAARVVGRRDGQWVRISRATLDHAPGSCLDTMESATGLSLAAFTSMALAGERRSGCLFPETWADPDGFLGRLAKLGERPTPGLVSEPLVEPLPAGPD